MSNKWIPTEKWEAIVQNAPIVSVDLVVLKDDGVLLGKRENEPAKGYWFVPGGRVQKGETRVEAVHRVADDELGVEINIIESLGAYEHLYNTSDVGDEVSKHYLANGYVVEVVDGEVTADDQHSAFDIFHEPPNPLHEYVANYLRDSKYVGWNL